MREALRLAATLAESALKPERRPAGGALVTLVLMLTAGCLACTATGFAITGLWLYLAPEIGRAPAAGVITVILVVASLTAFLIARSGRGAGRTRPAPAIDFQSLAKEANGLVREHKGALLAAAFVAGLLASEERNR
jgi:hypothetical protein